MRNLFAIILMVGSLGLTGCDQDIRLEDGKLSKSDGHAFVQALKSGLKAKVTLKIVDTYGAVVPDAIVLAHFEVEGREGIVGTADANGLFSMQDKSRGTMHYGVKKDGYRVVRLEIISPQLNGDSRWRGKD